MFDAGGSGGATATSVGALTGALARAIDDLLAVDPDGVSDAELAEAMLSLRRQQARLAAVVAEQTAAFEARQVHAEDGSRSATDWIAVHGRLPRGQVAGEVRDARRLRTMPETRAAFRAGDISAAHVRVLCRLAGHPRAGRHFPDGEAHLVGEGRRLRFDDWQRLCDYRPLARLPHPHRRLNPSRPPTWVGSRAARATPRDRRARFAGDTLDPEVWFPYRGPAARVTPAAARLRRLR
jgi:hypothetical protein